MLETQQPPSRRRRARPIHIRKSLPWLLLAALGCATVETEKEVAPNTDFSRFET